MKIYVDLENRQILKYDKEVDVFKGNVNIDKVKVYSIHHSANRPALLLSFKRADNRVISDILCDPNYPITDTIDDVEYDYYEFTLSAHNGVLAVDGALQCTLWANDGTNKYGVCNFTLNVVETVYNDSNIYIVDDTGTIIYDFKDRIEAVEHSLESKVSNVEFDRTKNSLSTDIASAESRAKEYADEMSEAAKNYANDKIGKAEIHFYDKSGRHIDRFNVNERSDKDIVIPIPEHYSLEDMNGYATGNDLEYTKVVDMVIRADTDNYIYTFLIRGKDGKVLASASMDLPLEIMQSMMLSDVTYDSNYLIFHFHEKGGNHIDDVKIPLTNLLRGFAKTNDLNSLKSELQAQIKDLSDKLSAVDSDGMIADISNKVDRNAKIGEGIYRYYNNDDTYEEYPYEVNVYEKFKSTTSSTYYQRGIGTSFINDDGTIEDGNFNAVVSFRNQKGFKATSTLYAKSEDGKFAEVDVISEDGEDSIINLKADNVKINSKDIMTVGYKSDSSYATNLTTLLQTEWKDMKAPMVARSMIQDSLYNEKGAMKLSHYTMLKPDDSDYIEVKRDRRIGSVQFDDDGRIAYQRYEGFDLVEDTRLATLEDVEKAIGNAGNVRYRNYVGDGTRFELGNVMRYGFLNSLKGNSVVSKNKVNIKTLKFVNGGNTEVGKVYLGSGTYTVTCSGIPSNITSSNYDINIFDNANNRITNLGVDELKSGSLTFTITTSGMYYIRTYANSTLVEFSVQFMLNEGTTALPYEPFGLFNSTVPAIKSVGRNLFDKDSANWRNGTLDNLSYISIHCTSGFFMQLSKGTYTLSVDTNCEYVVKLGTEKADYLNSTKVVLDSGWKSGSYTFTVNDNLYLGIQLRLSNNSDITFNDVKNYGWSLVNCSTAIPYEPYVEDYLVLSGNLFDLSTSEKGKYMSNTGAVGNAETSYLSDYIKVEPNTVYSHNTKQGCFLNFYDKSKTRLGGAISGNVNFTTPNNCYYIRITMDNGTLGNTTEFMLNVGKEALPYSPFGAIKQKVKRYLAEVSVSDSSRTGTSGGGLNYFNINVSNGKKNSSNIINSLGYQVETNVDTAWGSTTPCIVMESSYIRVYTSLTKLDITVVYELATPVEEAYDGVLRGIGEVRDVLIPSTDNEQMRLYKHGSIDTLSDVDVTIDYDYCVNTDESEGE